MAEAYDTEILDNRPKPEEMASWFGLYGVRPITHAYLLKNGSVLLAETGPCGCLFGIYSLRLANGDFGEALRLVHAVVYNDEDMPEFSPFPQPYWEGLDHGFSNPEDDQLDSDDSFYAAGFSDGVAVRNIVFPESKS